MNRGLDVIGRCDVHLYVLMCGQRAIKHYMRGVTLGDSASNYRMGMMTLLGQHGEQQNYSKGIEQIRFAANSADENAPQGAYVYGMLLSRELPNITIPDVFMSVDVEQAKQFIEKAAYLGFAKAQQKMGEAYELCLLGCEFNPALSLHYNSLAARQGDPVADMAISKWFLCGYEGVFAKNEALAYHYAERAATSGLPTAEFALGYFFEIGMYVAKDIDRAKEWYNSAAEHGNKDAVARLQGISQARVLTKQDHEHNAINRIKSQYGSKRGARPERLSQKVPTLPVMYEAESLQDPKISPPQNARQSIAPYPVDDLHQINNRTQSLRMSEEPVADRPSSAFGIRPNLVSTSAVYMQNNMRSSTSMSNISSHVGGGGPQERQGWSTNMSGRRISPNRSRPSTQLGDQNLPYTSRGASQAKLQKRHPTPQLSSHPQLQHSATDPTLSQHVSHTFQSPTMIQHSVNGPPSHLNGRSVSVAPQSQLIRSLDERSQSAVQRLPPQARPQSSSTNSAPGVSNRLSSAPIPGRVSPERKPVSPQRKPVQLKDEQVATPAVSSIPTPRPVGSGPKTFDEMGIPHIKAEGECVSNSSVQLFRATDT